MSEEFITDIISGGSTTIDSSSTETSESNLDADKASTLASDDKAAVIDQSSNQTTNADKDQNNSKLSVEELASQLGWRADHTGEDAVDAVTYILRSKDIQKSMSKHNKDLKENLSTVQASINALKEHNERVYQADVKKLQGEIATLKKERKSAIELADVNKVEELDEQIAERQKDIDTPKIDAVAKPSAANANPVFDEWVKSNDWYLKDDEMAKFADTVAQQYVGAPLDRIYKIVRSKVQEVFPDKFESDKTVVKPKPIGPTSPVDKGTNNKGNSSSFTKSDLSPEQINIMNQFVHGGIMTEEAYINDIAKMQE